MQLIAKYIQCHKVKMKHYENSSQSSWKKGTYTLQNPSMLPLSFLLQRRTEKYALFRIIAASTIILYGNNIHFPSLRWYPKSSLIGRKRTWVSGLWGREANSSSYAQVLILWLSGHQIWIVVQINLLQLRRHAVALGVRIVGYSEPVLKAVRNSRALLHMVCNVV